MTALRVCPFDTGSVGEREEQERKGDDQHVTLELSGKHGSDAQKRRMRRWCFRGDGGGGAGPRSWGLALIVVVAAPVSCCVFSVRCAEPTQFMPLSDGGVLPCGGRGRA
eukprot:2922421-Rhodomonas_salina.1